MTKCGPWTVEDNLINYRSGGQMDQINDTLKLYSDEHLEYLLAALELHLEKRTKDPK